jgi:hypothetical protein
MLKNMLLVTTLGFSLLIGGFWALKAQDPAPQKPSNVRTDRPTVSAQNQTVQTDLSGTYTGTFNCEGLGLTGETTLTINGNEFTTADGKTGRIVASTTGGYTAVALQLNATDPAAPPQVVSLRARKVGNRLMLMPVSGTAAGQRCSFVPGRAVARGRRNQRTPAATGTDVSSPAAVPTESPSPSTVPTESPMPAQTPSPAASPTPRRSPRPRPSPTPSGSPTPMPTPSPGEPTPSPTPSGSPTPMPTPSPGAPTPSPTPGEPTPSPSPGEPTPSPTPSPSPSPQP